MVSELTPILNNPYEAPRFHYATNLAGEIDYQTIQAGRRAFRRVTTPLPQQQNAQRDLLTPDDFSANEQHSFIELVRKEVQVWREGSASSAPYAGVTRVTADLLRHWFVNPDREPFMQFFFAQREAVEAAIWLNEVAEHSNAGQHCLSRLRAAQQSVAPDPSYQLPRLAFKLATGAGKTVVMAALITYHFFNRTEYPQNVRYADAFLLVAPGITIRDRLSVLRFDGGVNSTDYYTQRFLIPAAYRNQMGALNSKLALTNYHAFEPKNLAGNKKGCFDGKAGADGKKIEAKEDVSEVLRRLLKGLRPGSRLIVLNDEALHCYYPKEKGAKTEEEDSEEENKRAAVWFSGLREICQRYKVNAIYDLSATPYYLRGSGYEPYSLFPWIVTDFGLVEAIESGLVKIPFLPQADTSQELTQPILRNLYEHVRAELPRAGAATARKRAKAAGQAESNPAPDLPLLVKSALTQFYEHYQTTFKGPIGTTQLTFESCPPVFIVVCNNTSVSREVYKYIAGYELPGATPEAAPNVIPGAYELFSNYDSTHQPLRRPPTLLIDSDALENSGQINEDFKKVFSVEVEAFKKDYARIHGSGSAESITDAEILREVVNTVGKRNALGSHIRCVVSVSMLTEGWDANTVTHIMGLRAFGSQLLCEQVAGRALRRVSYALHPYDPTSGEALPRDTKRTKDVVWKFPPEYAHIIGVPFMPFKGGSVDPVPPEPTTRIEALKDRAHLEIIFPHVLGYRVEYPEAELVCDYSNVEPFLLDFTTIPTQTTLASAFGPQQETLTLDQLLAKREQEIIYQITRHLLAHNFTDTDGNRQFQKFADLKRIVTHWYHHAIKVTGTNEPLHRKVIFLADPGAVCRHLAQGINPGQNSEEFIRPILNHYVPTGSTTYVHGTTTRPTYPTIASHVNYVVADTESWEQIAAKSLDELASENILTAYVKNAFLGFRIPYQKPTGEGAYYEPDFLIRAPGGTSQQEICLILEITGMNKEKAEKRWFTRHRWLPAVNSVATHFGWPRWHFLEIDSEEKLKDIKAIVTATLAKL